jgi:DNA-binding FrmR family transcriptional regulator/nucleoside 2-deoxyribosyltransferase
MKMIKPAKLKSRLRRVHRREQGLNLTMGLLLLCNWIAILFLVGFTIDWLIRLPVFLRMIILVPLLAFPIAKAWQSGWRFFRPWFSSPRTALKVEDHYRNFKSLLVSGVQLSASRAVSGTSAGMAALTVEQANEAADQVDAEKVVPFKPIGVPGLLGGLLLASLCVFAVIDFPLFKTAATRLFTPWVAIEYPTRTQVEVVAGEWIVKEGGEVNLVAKISGEIPDSAKIILRTGQGKPRERSLVITGGVCEYEAKTVFRSFDFRISAGDARSPWQTVRVISAPRIERAEVTLEFPEYTQRSTETVEALTLTVPEGTTIKWKLSLDRPVDEAEFRPAEGEAQALVISVDGHSITMQQVASGSRSYSFGWVDKEHGFTFSSPRHYLQVAPDRAPSVDLTSPSGNLFATLQRNLDFAFRGRDDHGIGEAVIAYRRNKIAEVKVPISQATPSDGSEQQIDWDYHESLPDLAVGDTLTFAVELTDRYPGAEGPHRARSDARRVQFLSKEDYLKQIEKQKRRMLARLRTIYREERAVCNIVSSLDPSDDVFIQTCQLEAVRQDLMRERLNVLRRQMNDLVEDLDANNLADAEQAASLVQLASDLQAIADEHVGRAASMFRELTGVSDEASPGRDPTPAIHMVNSAARELALLFFQLGFNDAADVMARELHATAQNQAALRSRTIMHGGSDAGHGAGNEELAKAQTRLAAWCTRLLSAAPRNKESSRHDALVAFNLSRLTKKLLTRGTADGMREAAALIEQATSKQAVHLQAEAIAALLDAEFRLRIGAEYEALLTAGNLFAEQAASQKQLREESARLTPEEFAGKQAEIAKSQAAIHRPLQMLLMPSVPAPRPRLFDAVSPSPPPVNDLLADAENALEAAFSQIKSGDRASAASHQQQAEAAFAKLAEIVSQRMEAMTQVPRMSAMVIHSVKLAAQIVMFEERLLALLERVEDAADDDVNTVASARLNRALADDIEGFHRIIDRWNKAQLTPNEDDLPLLDHISHVARLLTDTTPLLEDNKPDKAIEFQNEALSALEEAAIAIANLTKTRADFASVVESTKSVLTPGPKLAEIEAEQIDLTEVSGKARPEELPGLVIPQKNLIHAVDAVVASLDPFAHRIESGTVMLFAKEDMDAAAVGLENDDVEDALDAQSYVAESLQELREKIDNVTPEYRYVLEVSEFLYELVPESARIQTGARQLLADRNDAPDAGVLKSKTEQFGDRLNKLTGEQRFVMTTRQLGEAVEMLKVDDPKIEDALDALVADTEELQTLTKNLAYLVTPPPIGIELPEPEPETLLLEKVLGLAAHHKDLSRKTQTVAQEQLAKLAAQQRELASQCEALIPASQSHPNLLAAHRHLIEAVAPLEGADRDAAVISHYEASEVLRYFILEYALKYVVVPPPGGGDDLPGAAKDTPPMEKGLELFMPGVITGTKPKGGRLEWQVIGRRDRAALNENFARELPLEYRAILKDYYERLTE